MLSLCRPVWRRTPQGTCHQLWLCPIKVAPPTQPCTGKGCVLWVHQDFRKRTSPLLLDCIPLGRPLFLIGVWHIKQKRRAWLRWVYNLLVGLTERMTYARVVIVLHFYLLEQCLNPVLPTSIKTCNFVTFYKFLIHLVVHHTIGAISVMDILLMQDYPQRDLFYNKKCQQSITQNARY